MTQESKTIKQAIKDAAGLAYTRAKENPASSGKELNAILESIAEQEAEKVALTKEAVRKMVPRLEFEEGSDPDVIQAYNFGYIYKIVYTGEKFNVNMYSEGVDEPDKIGVCGSLVKAKGFCQKDFEDRVLRCLGFEPKKGEDVH